MAEPWLSSDDTAAHLGITKGTVYSGIDGKATPAHTVGRLWKFPASEIDAWVRAGAAIGDAEPWIASSVVGGHAYSDGDEADEEGWG